MSLLQGDLEGAGLSALSAIPGPIGNAAGITKIARKANKAADVAEKSAKSYTPKGSPGGRSKIQTGEDALDQLEGVTKKQENLRNGKGTGLLDSKKKSVQRVDNKNRKIQNLEEAYDEYPDY